jgi:PAS domain S-box-containing protein
MDSKDYGIENDLNKESFEEDLKESENKYRAVFENANDMISLNLIEDNGLPGRFIDINEVGIKRLGYSYDEFLNMTPADIIAKDNLPKIQKNASKLAENGRGKYEIVHQTKDGRRIPVEVNNHLFELRGKKVALAICRDITERKKSEEALKESRNNLRLKVKERTLKLEGVINELKRSNDELEQFAYVASHDLKEPLRMIISFLSLLDKRYKDQLDDDANEFIKYSIDGANRMDMMIDDLLEYSRIQSQEEKFEYLQSDKILETVLSNLKSLIKDNNTIITYDPLPLIFANEQQMIQLFQNVVANAIKYRTERNPEIHISAENTDEGYMFCIKDNGIGIDKKQLKRIFTIFQRLHSRDEYEGTGIGLAISKKIIEKHRGKIWAESELGKGSKFCFTIPNLRY